MLSVLTFVVLEAFNCFWLRRNVHVHTSLKSFYVVYMGVCACICGLSSQNRPQSLNSVCKQFVELAFLVCAFFIEICSQKVRGHVCKFSLLLHAFWWLDVYFVCKYVNVGRVSTMNLLYRNNIKILTVVLKCKIFRRLITSKLIRGNTITKRFILVS